MISTSSGVRRVILAVAGTAGTALANFVLAMLLLRSVSAAQFGVFAFINVIIGLGYGVSNALFGSPLTVLLNRLESPKAGATESFFRANFILTVGASFLLAAIVLSFGEAMITAALFALSAMLLWTRWFGRSYAHATHEPQRVVASDACYTALTISGAFFLLWVDAVSISGFAGLQALGAGLGTLALGKTSLAAQISGLRPGSLLPFRSAFREHGRHALVGVVSTEATANAHAYIVTLFLGPAAFAPLAAAALLFRPIPIVILSMTQLERPRLAHLLREGAPHAARRVISLFRNAVLGCWAANAILAYFVVTFFLESVIRGDYDPQVITKAVIFWGLIMGLRCLRGPESALLQANGEFRPLARVTVVSGLISIPLVLLFVFVFGAVWSLAAVLAGELAATIRIKRLARTQMEKHNHLVLSCRA